jgi:hypothetical protein
VARLLSLASRRSASAARRHGPARRAGAAQRRHHDTRRQLADRRHSSPKRLSHQTPGGDQGAPRLYFVYPPDWTYTFTESVYEYYHQRHNIRFSTVSSPQAGLRRFQEHVDGYVVWDPKVRTSLIVAFTVADLEDAVVVTEDQIPLIESFGLEAVEDFRGQFVGQSDYEIYRWAWEQYGDRNSTDFIVWMGGRPAHGAGDRRLRHLSGGLFH